MKNIKKLSQRGDTIVEVLICLAVFGAMLTAAFALTNRNQATSQAAQERSQAVKIADSQLELLRTYTDANKLPPLPANKYFCMGSNVQTVSVSDVSSPGAACKTSTAQNGGRYTYVIYSPAEAVAVGGNGTSYAVIVTWEGMVTQDEQVKIFYSIYDTENPAYNTNVDDGHEELVSRFACEDGQDNDGDGKIDYVSSNPDPGCSSSADADEADSTTFTGYLTVAADCYAPGDPNAGCPVMNLLFTWSDGSTDPLSKVVSGGLASSGGFAQVDYSFTKPQGVTLKTVRVTMAEDKFGGSPSQDRNLYVQSLTHMGAPYSHTQATPYPCAANSVTDFPRMSSSKMLCDVNPTTFFLNAAERPKDSCPAKVVPADSWFNAWHLYNSGGTKPSQPYTYTNPAGCGPLQVGTVSLTNTTDFSITSNGCNNTTLAAGASCTVWVQFYPPSANANNSHGRAGNKTATLTMTNGSYVSNTSAQIRGKAVSDRLAAGDTLNRGESIHRYESSCYNNAESCGSRLIMQTDGNLVLYEVGGAAVWSTSTFGATRAVMQTDGNFVVYNGNSPMWYAKLYHPSFTYQSGDYLALSKLVNTNSTLLNHKRSNGANYFNYYDTGRFY